MAKANRLMPQSTLIFLFITVIASLLLHAGRLPVWLIAYSILAFAWRGLMFKGLFPKPHWPVKLCWVVAGFSGIYVSYGLSITIESMVSLLLAGVMLKPLEVERQADSYVLVFLNYFLCSLLFLFDRTPLDFLLVLIVMVLTLSSQVLIHYYDHPNRLASVKTAVFLFLKSLPLAVFLFFILPRFGPLWTLNIPTQAGVIGLSDSMSPGSIAELGKNNELAFRVKIQDGQLPMNQRYWRAFTLDEFDGQEWTQSQNLKYFADRRFYQADAQSVQYEILLEPHEEFWLFSVGSSSSLSDYVIISHDASLRSKRRLYRQLKYQVKSNVSTWIEQPEISSREFKQYTKIPNDVNPKSIEFANLLFNQGSDISAYLNLIQAYFGSNGFTYTLSPGEFDGDDQIDGFLFDSKKGFCSYYAGSFAFLMRAVGIPARVVLGYLGGEENSISGALSVYQHDAHAWVEVWIEGKGWLQVDPTAWVAPDRVESGLQSAIPQEFSGFNSQYEWVKLIRLQWQAFDYLWNDWMISYKGSKQQALLEDVLGQRSTNELIVIVISLLTLLISSLFAFLWWDQLSKSESNEQKVVSQLLSWLNKHGSSVDNTLTLKQVFDRLIVIYPLKQSDFELLSQQIERCLYHSVNSHMTKQQRKFFVAEIQRIKKSVQ